MQTPVFREVQDAIIDLIVGVQIGSPAQPLFNEIFVNGSPGKFTDMPVAVIEFGDNDARETETSSKILNVMPWSLEAQIDVNSLDVPDQPIRDVHSQVYELVYDAVMGSEESRRLGGVARVTRYAGRGTRLSVVDQDDDPSRRSFTLEFETDYRHKSATSAA